MRRLIPYLLILGVVLFYAGSAGAAAAPYYGAVKDFVAGAAARDPAPRMTAAATAEAGHATARIKTAVATIPAVLVRTSAPAAPTAPARVATPARSSTPPDVTGEPVTPRHPAHAVAPVKGKAVATLTPRQLTAEVQHIRATKAPQGRTNILILGSDNDQKFASYSHPLTQVMIVLSLDNVRHKITLLSISRDLWVHIPGYQYNVGPDGTTGWSKIDVASKLGFDSSACTVETNFGIHIDHWIWVGLKGFTKVIDTLHGATLDVTYPVMDDTYPDDLSGNPNAYRRIYIPPGPQHLNGADALHFVRSRHGDAQGDFARSSRQQILIDQLRRTFAGQDTTTLVSLLPRLLSDFKNELKTDSSIDFETAAQYVQLFQELKHDKPTQVVLSPPYSYGQTTYDYDPDVERATGFYPTQEDALAPNFYLINPLITGLFGGQVQPDSQFCGRVPGATPR